MNGQTLAVLDANGTELFYNIYGLDLIGQYDVAAGKEFYHLKDHLGNIRVTIDDNGDVLAYNDYYPFGLQMPGRNFNQGLANDLYKYSGKELDEETGLNWYYFGGRYYDAEVGRWLSVDPLSGNYLNLSPYVYAINNPMNIIDPNGMEWYEITEEYQEDEEYIDEKGETKTRKVTKTKKVWKWFKDKSEMKIWTGEYFLNGNKVFKIVQGKSHFELFLNYLSEIPFLKLMKGNMDLKTDLLLNSREEIESISEVATLGSFIGIDFISIGIGKIPQKGDLFSQINFGSGDYLSIGFGHNYSKIIYNGDPAGYIIINLGLGAGLPISLKGSLQRGKR